MQIYQYAGPFVDIANLDLFALLPDWKIGFILWSFAAVLMLCGLIYPPAQKILGLPAGLHKPGQRPGAAIQGLVFPSLILAGFFINCYGLKDEVMVNLEHPYNLLHYGLFSMSPQAMIDGTVELIYYLLHTPFAVTKPVLVLGNFLLSFLTAWAHLFLIWKYWFREYSRRNILVLSLFALSFPLVRLWASGYGNGLVSLFFLYAVLQLIKGNYVRALAVNGLLPLIRPDAAVTSGVTVLVFFIVCIRQRRRISRRELCAAILLPAFTIALYLIIFRVFYGHWIPTPIVFKSINGHMMLSMFEAEKCWSSLRSSISEPMTAIYFLCAVCGAAALLFTKKQAWSELKIMALYLLFFLPQYLLFNASAGVVWNIGYEYPRYWVCLLLILALLFIRLIYRTDVLLENSRKWAKAGSVSLGFVLVFFWLGLSAQKEISRNITASEWSNRNDLALAGAFADRILPRDWRVAATEMNTFGLASERPVLDLWGFSNREIAASRICSGAKLRNNPDYFLREKPEVSHEYHYHHWRWLNYDDAEKTLLSDHHVPENLNLYGDMRQVLPLYDLFLIDDSNSWERTAYLVRKDKSGELIKILGEQSFILQRQRPLDQEKYFKGYNRDKLIQYVC